LTSLRKSDAELLLAAIDTPLLVDALRAALARVLVVEPFDDDWGALVRLAGDRALWDASRVHALVERHEVALATLAIDLSELRTL
jgi:hypothetical protein